MTRLPLLLVPLGLLLPACTARPHHRQNYAFGFAPWIGLRGPKGPTGLDVELFPPAAYANAFQLVSANLSANLVELYLFPVSVGWQIGTDPQERERGGEAPPPSPKERQKEREEATTHAGRDAGSGAEGGVD
ncbi:MAG TPA: hypothetical protein VFI25_03030 [Planctomycetota bacterium]|jgi:hypothetical protein|nr:hypothetical protein [Planctomycetota bacterium]